MGKSFRDKRPQSTETVHLGTYIHPCEDLLVLKLEHRDIPYPNSPVLQNGRQIGKIDEVFGPVDNVFASVRLEGDRSVSDFKVEARLEGYRDKFIFRDRFLPREEVERKKERDDRSKRDAQKKTQRPGDRKKQNFRDNKFGGRRGDSSGRRDSDSSGRRGDFRQKGRPTDAGSGRKDFRRRND